MSASAPIVVDYDPRLDEERIERLVRSARVREYPKEIIALYELDSRPAKRWAFVSNKNRDDKHIYLVPLSMVPEAEQ